MLKTRCETGSPLVGKKLVVAVTKSVVQSLIKSTRKNATEVQVQPSTMHNHMKKDLEMKSFTPVAINEFTDMDIFRHCAACALFILQI